MNNPILILVAVLLGLGIGFVMARLLSQQQIRSLETERANSQNATLELKKQAETWRNELDQTSDERAMFAERASRLPALEQKLNDAEQKLSALHPQIAQLHETLGRTAAELKATQEAHTLARENYQSERQQREHTQNQLAQLETAHARLQTQLAAEQQQSAEKLSLLLEAKDTLGNQFKTLANDILEEKAKRFTEQNQTNLGQLLDPLKTRLQEFQNKVETVYVQEGKDRTALAEQVRQLMDLNQTLSQDAKNLTSALKGSNKTQGNWGELVLERVLEASGLRRGEEYEIQQSHTSLEGQRFVPDVIIRLPEERSLVIDSKMSLTAYEAYMSSDDETVRQTLLKRHLESVRAHIKELSAKNYQTLHQLKSLDFVLMFVPVEPAFMLAISNDNAIFMDAWEKNVLLVSPSTLLFVVRTVAHLWRQEAQNRNAQEIANRGAALYDKLVGFVTDLEKIGEQLGATQKTYDNAFRKLKSGNGNLIGQAQKLQDLGVKPTKTLPTQLQEDIRDKADKESYL